MCQKAFLAPDVRKTCKWTANKDCYRNLSMSDRPKHLKVKLTNEAKKKSIFTLVVIELSFGFPQWNYKQK